MKQFENTLLGQFIKEALTTTNQAEFGRRWSKIYNLSSPEMLRKTPTILKDLNARDPIDPSNLLILTKQNLDKNENVTSSTYSLRKSENIDTSGMVVSKVTKNPYGGEYVSYKPNEEGLTGDLLEQLRKQLDEAEKPVKIQKIKGKKIGVAALADFHIGAKVQDLLKTPDFNIGILSIYLQRAAELINGRNYKEVHVALLGDFIESFTGLNHLNVWQEMGYMQFGANAVILATEIIRDSLLANIKNLKSVYIVSGNHDRATNNKDLDPYGQVGQLLAYNLKRDLKGVEVKYHPLILTEVIDNISYLFSHGHHRLTEKDINGLCFQYGKQEKYNVLLKGHIHTRKTKVSKNTKPIRFTDFTGVQVDSNNIRAINIAPCFTGNFYSESNGWTSTGGFQIVENNGSDKINTFDYCF